MATAAASLDFAGTSDYISVGDNNQLDGSTEITMMAFARPESVAGATKTLLQKPNPATAVTDGLLFGLYRSGHEVHCALVNDAGGTAFVKTSGLSGGLNTWYHWAFTWDAAISSTFLTAAKFYQDGTQATFIDSFNGTTTVTQVNNSNGTMQIGRRGTATETWEGQLAHVKLYDRALTQNEIIDCSHNPEAVVDGLISWWPLLGVAAEDLTAGGYDGTITGTVVDSDRGPSYFLCGGK
jgi:hypothetical protein